MQRGSPQVSQVVNLGTNIHLVLRVDCKLCVLAVSPGLVYMCHGVPREKGRKRNFPRWAPILVVQSHWHIATSDTGKSICGRPSNIIYWEFCGAQTRWSKMVGSRPDIFLTSIWIQKSPENSQNVVPSKTDYSVATVKAVLTLAQSAASVIPVPFLNAAIGVALKIIQVCEVRWILTTKIQDDWSSFSSGSIGCWR